MAERATDGWKTLDGVIGKVVGVVGTSRNLELPKAEGGSSPLPRESTTKVLFPQFWPFFSSALTPLSTAFLTERARLPLPK